jgi:hypothetical protein
VNDESFSIHIESSRSIFRFFDKHGVGNYLIHECKTKPDEHVEITVREK